MNRTANSHTNFLTECDYAHRGLHRAGGPVENSLPAFTAALDAGHGMECDVRLSRDGRAIVFHDRLLDRLTDARGLLADRSADELAAIQLKDAGGSIPTLAALLALVAGRAPLLVEIKIDADTDPARLCRAVEDDLAGYAGSVAVMSFSAEAMGWFRRHAPGRVRGMVLTDRDGWWKRLRRPLDLARARPDFLACDIRCLPSRTTRRARAHGLPVLCWTVRTDADHCRARAHADAIIFEEPR